MKNKQLILGLLLLACIVLFVISEVKAKKNKETTIEPTPDQAENTYQMGSTGHGVRQIQTLINLFVAKTPLKNRLRVDGVWGRDTELGVMAIWGKNFLTSSELTKAISDLKKQG